MEIAQVLLEHGADYAKAYTCSAQCLLADAAQNHKEDDMRLLIDKKIAHGSSSSRISITPFEMAAVMGHVELANMLADTGSQNIISDFFPTLIIKTRMITIHVF